MNASELKLKIFRQIDSLEKSSLESIYGVLSNLINGEKDLDEWAKLSDDQKQGIIDAIQEIDSGKGIPHEQVMNHYRQKYSRA